MNILYIIIKGGLQDYWSVKFFWMHLSDEKEFNTFPKNFVLRDLNVDNVSPLSHKLTIMGMAIKYFWKQKIM